MATSSYRTALAAAQPSAAPAAGLGGHVVAVAFIVLTLAYPSFLYDSDIGRALTPLGVFLFWLHTAITAGALLAAIQARAAALTIVQLFHWLFFVVALREQLIHQWDGIFEISAVVDRGLVYLIVYEIVLLAVYFAFVIVWGAPRASESVPPRRDADNSWLLSLVLACLVCNVFLIFAFGETLFHSRVAFNNRSQEIFPQQSVLVYRQFLRPMLYFIPLFILQQQLMRPRWHTRPSAIVLVALAAVTAGLGYLFNSPICSPRFHAGAIAVGTVMLFVGPRRLSILLGILIFGLVIAPFFNSFRNQWTRDRSDYALPSVDLEHFRSWDFDAFVNYLYSIHYVNEYGHYAGRNILSALLFFVPNEIWSGKISNSGATVMSSVAWQFRGTFPWNSSMPMIGEGFLAFGPAGVVGIAIVFAAAIRFLDMAPRLASAATGLFPRTAMLAFAPVLLFFFCRGTLVPAFAYGSGTLAAAAVAALLIGRVAKNRDAAGDDGGEKGDRSSGFARAGFAKRLRRHRARREAAVLSVPPSRGSGAPATPASEGAQRTTRRSSGPIFVSARRVDEGASAGPGFHR